jgi:hypothetical protein
MAASDSQFLVNPNTNFAGGGQQAGSLHDIRGGIYVLVAVASAWNGATLTLNMVGPDGVTLVPAGAATTLTGNGNGVAYLPPGLVTATLSGGTPTGLYVSIARVVS